MVGRGLNLEIVIKRLLHHAWTCDPTGDPTTIFAGVDISKVPVYHLLQQLSYQGLLSHKLAVYLSALTQ